MTSTEYWQKEINKACNTHPDIGPEIVAALVIAGQLQAITTVLSEIRNKLEQIEDSIANN